MPRSLTAASTAAPTFLGEVQADSSALMQIESMPLFLPSTMPRAAPTSSDEYGSIAGGSWNCAATAPDSRVKRFSPVTGFQGASS